MSIEIKELPNNFCKIDCPKMDLYVDSIEVHSADRIEDRLLKLACRNEELCRYLRNEHKAVK